MAARAAAGASVRAAGGSPLLMMMLRRSGGSVARSSSVLAGQLGSSISSSSISSSSSALRPATALLRSSPAAWEGARQQRRWMMSEGNGEKKEGEQQQQQQQGAKAEGEAAPEDEKQKLIEKLQAENKELKDKVLYTLAEMENVRTIARRDMDNSKQFAIQSFAKQLLDVADNLSRALESVPADVLAEKKEENALLVTLVEGVRMTDQQLAKVFGANKIVKYGAPGDKFDPNVHDALFEYEDPGKEPGCVGQVLKTGYKLNDRVIRPAQVGTVKKG